MLYTNVDSTRWAFLELAKAGYGTYAEISDLDTDEFLDMLEHASIASDLLRHDLDNGR